MKYLHKQVKAGRNCVVVVNFDQPCKVMLLKDSQYLKYKDGKTYDYRGGFSENSPVKFILPEGATWHVIIERGSYFNPANINSSVNILPAGTEVEAATFGDGESNSKRKVILKLEKMLEEENDLSAEN